MQQHLHHIHLWHFVSEWQKSPSLLLHLFFFLSESETISYLGTTEPAEVCWVFFFWIIRFFDLACARSHMTTSLMLFTSPHHTIQGTSGGVWTRSHTYRHRSCEKPPVFSLCRVMWARATYQPTSIHELLPTVHPYVDLLCGVFRKREVYLMELYVWLQGWRQRRHTEPQRQCPKDKQGACVCVADRCREDAVKAGETSVLISVLFYGPVMSV